MFRRILAAVLVTAVACGPVFAGEGHGTTGANAGKTTKTDKMADMKAEMMKCAVCKNFAAHWDEFAPSMKTEVVKMNNGFAIAHAVTDPTKVAVFHSSCDLTDKAGGMCMQMTDEQAGKELCSFCQGIRGVMKSGGNMSVGKTSNGSIMVLSSDDPTLQGKIMAMYGKCSMEMASTN